MNEAIFKAYDVRGKYPVEINEAVVVRITRALVKKWGNKAQIVIGHDARLSSPELYKAVSSYDTGCRKIGVGMVTTPMFYYLVNHFKARGGIMITASHNPKEYNGLKVVRKGAVPVSGKEALQLVHNF